MTTLEELLGPSYDMDALAERCGPVVKGMYQYYNTTSIIPQPEIALFVALEAIGIICGRVWQADKIKYGRGFIGMREIPGATTTDYLTILARTCTGKEAVKSVLNKFLENLGITIAPNVTGAPALYAEAMRSPRIVLIQDEAGLRRQSAGTGRGDPYGPRTAETLLMDVYNNRDRPVNPPLYAAGKDNPHYRPIRRQAISCVMISTPETYEDALQSGDARSGYLGRHVMIRSSRSRPPKLGPANENRDEAREHDEYLNDLMRPFWAWRRYHAGSPDLDTYGQLIRPYLATAWWITQHVDANAAAAADDMRNRNLKYKPRREHKPVWDEGQPFERVVYGPGAASALTEGVYEQNEAYIAEHPETLDLLARKMQHISQYAMRIALARHAIGLGKPTVSAEPPKSAEPQKEPETEADYNQIEAAWYADCKTIPDIRARADADKDARDKARNTWTDAAKRVEELKGGKKEDYSVAVAALMIASIKYHAKIHACEEACKRAYEQNPPVITVEDVLTAKEIIDIAEKSSLESLIDSIPADKWYEAKEEAIRILTKAGEAGLPSSVLEKKLKKYNLGDKYARMIAELEDEGRIRTGLPNPNGGFRVFIIPSTEE